MYCFESKNCNNLDCPVRRLKEPRCWEFFKKNASTDAEYEKRAVQCEKCNYKLGWEIGLISDDNFKDSERIFIDELIPESAETSSSKELKTANKEKRFCYEIMDCHNALCPVREQQIIRCFKFFQPRSAKEKEKITCCSRTCDKCFYKTGWDIGTISESNFADIIQKKKSKLQSSVKYKKDLIVSIYMAELAKKPLSHDEEIALAKKIAGDKEASEIFLMANLKLVTKIAQKFTSKMPFMDLIQEGNIGLIKAISKFDYRLGYKFSTYASYWIKYYMQKAVSEQASSISIPCHLIAVANKIKRHIHKFEEELSRPPTLAELSDILGLEEEKIVNIINVT
ncbi:MAG: sigma-70 family RNA polymerase sigma factor, partial [Candidatus Riflebacteria bacterium]|nr:sigma-70 family RNA polymerase sigma factor [Candidatus Riflebacteria bacterium]